MLQNKPSSHFASCPKIAMLHWSTLVEATQIVLRALRSSLKLNVQSHVTYEIDLKFLVPFKQYTIPSRQQDLLSYCIRIQFCLFIIIIIIFLFSFFFLFFNGHYTSWSSCSHSQPPKLSFVSCHSIF